MLSAARSCLRLFSPAPSGRCLLSTSQKSFGWKDSKLVVESPYSFETVAEVSPTRSPAELLDRSQWVQRMWGTESKLSERKAVCERFAEELEKEIESTAELLAKQMGKPLSQGRNEVKGAAHRSRVLVSLADQALADVSPDPKNPLLRIKHEPVGVVFLIAPWNYPLLTAVNCLVASVLAGNSVVIKHSPVTPLCADLLVRAFEKAGAPEGLVTALHCPDQEVIPFFSNFPAVQFVSFTGSVPVGRKIYQAVAAANVGNRFLDCTLELGGKDAAYVAADANLDHAVASLVDGAMYNSGQSCCAIERVYVHSSVHAEFVKRATELVIKDYKLGDPLDEKTTMGPMALPAAPAFLAKQVSEAVAAGAVLHCGGAPTSDGSGKGRFFQPTVISKCPQSSDLMQTESFGPILPIHEVASDAEAVAKMNDSQYGLTAAIYTNDTTKADQLGAGLKVGTVFMNRCDYLEPLLPWSGHKLTGKGLSLSQFGFRGVTRLKGYNYRVL